MPRQPRQDFEGAYHHVMARGNNGAKVFNQDIDRLDFLGRLGEVCERYKWRIYAYCLMDNHYHLLVHTPRGNLSLGMKDLNSYHTRRMNWRYESYGHVFQGRFKSYLIGDDAYMLEVIRYIAMNPVEAGIARTPKDWRWSSYGHQVAGKGSSNGMPWLEVAEVLKAVGGKSGGGAALKKFVTARSEAAKLSRARLKDLMEVDHQRERKRRTNGIIKDGKAGLPKAKIAEKWGVNRSTVHRILKSAID